MPAFIETLVLIFCGLIHSNALEVISFLKEIHLNGSTGLELFVQSFCEVFPDLQGVYQVKLGISVMIILLNQPDPQLHSIMVKGDLIVDNNSRRKKSFNIGIVTRSISKTQPDKYSVVPFAFKAVQCLLNEYQSQIESKMQTKPLQNPNLEFDQDSEGYETASENDELGYFDFSDAESENSDYADAPVYQLDICVEIQKYVKEVAQKPSLIELFNNLSLAHQNLIQELIQ
jgi:hypothetical protein